ncbi:unnamed protein product [Caretta caretta]
MHHSKEEMYQEFGQEPFFCALPSLSPREFAYASSWAEEIGKSQLKVITREKLQRYSEGRVTQMLVTIQFCGGEESGSDTRIKVSSEFSSVVQWLHIATAINNTKMSDSSQPQKLSQEQRLKWKVPTQMEQDSGSLKCKAPQRFSP